MSIAVSRDHGTWYVTAEDFGVVGAGASEHSAFQNLGEVLSAFLHDYYERGLPFDAVLGAPPSPAPRRPRSIPRLARFAYRQLAQRFAVGRHYTLPLRSVLQ